jgi:hypothetical protein
MVGLVEVVLVLGCVEEFERDREGCDDSEENDHEVLEVVQIIRLCHQLQAALTRRLGKVWNIPRTKI